MKGSKFIAIIDRLLMLVGTDGELADMPLDDRIRLTMGQDYPPVPPEGSRWRMSNRALYDALQAALQALADTNYQNNLLQFQLNQFQQAVPGMIAAALASYNVSVVQPLFNSLLGGQLPEAMNSLFEIVQQLKNDETGLASLLANQAADRLRFSALEPRMTAVEDVALGAKNAAVTKAERDYVDQRFQTESGIDTQQAAAILALQNALKNDENGLQAILVTQGQQAASISQLTQAVTAQGLDISNRLRKNQADNTAFPLSGVKATTNGQFVVFEQVRQQQTLQVATPAGLVLAVGKAASYPFTWPEAFTTATYSLSVYLVTDSLLPVQVRVTKTATGGTVTLTNTSLASLTLGAGLIDLTATK